MVHIPLFFFFPFTPPIIPLIGQGVGRVFPLVVSFYFLLGVSFLNTPIFCLNSEVWISAC